MWDPWKSRMHWFRGSIQEVLFSIHTKGGEDTRASEKTIPSMRGSLIGEDNGYLQGEIMVLSSMQKGEIF